MTLAISSFVPTRGSTESVRKMCSVLQLGLIYSPISANCLKGKSSPVIRNSIVGLCRPANQRGGLRRIKGGGWIDTCSVARRVWPHLPSHKLSSLARTFRISYRAHDATEDARCAGEILVRAAKISGLSITEFLRDNTAYNSQDF